MKQDLEILQSNQLKYNVVPDKHNNKRDPRSLLYHYPSLPIVKYAKLMQEYMHNSMLKLAQDMADQLCYVLVPASCIHWERVKKIGNDRRVRVGRHNFYLLLENEMTKTEVKKLLLYMDKLND